MKLSLTLLATASYCAPERKKQQKANDRLITPPVPCSTPRSQIDGIWIHNGGSPFSSIDNGGSGQVTFDSYVRNVNCYVDIGANCDGQGVQVVITHMELEPYHFYDDSIYDYNYVGCSDSINFTWLNKDGETVEQTDPQCGCLGEDHPSCDPRKLDDYSMVVTEKPTQYNVVGTDVKLVLRSDNAIDGGKIQVDWKCNTPITSTVFNTSTTTKSVTNTLEMAEALLTGSFTPEMGRDYGCAGRGLFDPFAHTIGSHVDDVDAAFFVWKKCIQCASGNNKSNVLAYSYDVDSDTCANGPSRSYCECDRKLMNFLSNEDVTAEATDYQAEQCIPGTVNELECCQYDTHFWAHYNPERSCCGPDGVKEQGGC